MNLRKIKNIFELRKNIFNLIGEFEDGSRNIEDVKNIIRDIDTDNFIFRYLCTRGHLEIAQWIFGLGNINIHSRTGEAFCYACCNGHFEVVQWLFGLGDIDIHFRRELSFRLACEKGHLEIAKWLLEKSLENKELGVIDIHDVNEDAFRWACKNGQLEVAKWLFGLGDIDIHAENEGAFYWAYDNDRFVITKWLLSFYSKKQLINLNHHLAKEEIKNREKSRTNLILYLFEKKYKMLDINAIALIWKNYI